jgi:hypothetical protein
MMEYDKKYTNVYVHYDEIWSKIESLFHINYDDTQSVMRVWMEEDYNLEGVRPVSIKDIPTAWLEND